MDIDRWFEELDVDRSESLESAEVATMLRRTHQPHGPEQVARPAAAQRAALRRASPCFLPEGNLGRLHDLIFLRRAGHAQVRQLMMELDVANHGHVHRREFEEWYTTQVRNEESERGAQRGAPR